MKKIFTSKLKDYFDFNPRFKSLGAFYYYHQTIFNTFAVAIVFMTINLVAWAITRNSSALIIPLTIMVFLVYNYLSANSRIRGVQIRRELTGTDVIGIVEGQKITVRYIVSNHSSMKVNHLVFYDVFDGNRDKINAINLHIPLRPGHTMIINKSYACNAGMGKKYFGPLYFTIFDLLHIFNFHFVDDERIEIIVYPKIEEIADLQFHGNKDSISFGTYDVPARGESVNFVGVREYVDGDPVNRINWKLSLKGKKMIVNEFEKNVNTDITILLNTEKRIHMGQDDLSTWEYCKDLTLAIASAQLNRGNSVRIFTNNNILPPGYGSRHLNFLEIFICKLEMAEDPDSENFVGRTLPLLKSDSEIFYITPCLSSPYFERNLHTIKSSFIADQVMRVILVDGSKELLKHIDAHELTSIIHLLKSTSERVEFWKQELGYLQLNHVIVKSNIPYEYIMKEALIPIHRKQKT